MAFLCHHRWTFLLACSAVLLLAAAAAGEDRSLWLADRNEATRQAAGQGKLLLIVQFSGDFAVGGDASSEAATYRAAALADARVARLLARRFVVTYQQVGSAESLRRLSPVKNQPLRVEYALTYICLPDQRVIHFIPGFVSSEELRAELAWAEQCYAQTLHERTAEALAARQAHRGAVAKADLPLFERAVQSRWRDDLLVNGPSTVELPAILAAACGTLETSLAQRLGQGWQRTTAAKAVPVLAKHARLARDAAHLALSEFPLVALGDLERPAYEAFTGERFWRASRRRQELADWLRRESSAGRPILLVVSDDAFSRELITTNPLVWPPAKSDALPLLPKFAVEVVSLDELAALTTDAMLGAIEYRAETPPRYVLLAASGKTMTPLFKGASLTRLAQAMNAAAGAGALATTTTGAASDDD
jgi:hypothetical protein